MPSTQLNVPEVEPEVVKNEESIKKVVEAKEAGDVVEPAEAVAEPKEVKEAVETSKEADDVDGEFDEEAVDEEDEVDGEDDEEVGEEDVAELTAEEPQENGKRKSAGEEAVDEVSPKKLKTVEEVAVVEEDSANAEDVSTTA